MNLLSLSLVFAGVSAMVPTMFYPDGLTAADKGKKTFADISMVMSHDSGAIDKLQTFPAAKSNAAICQDTFLGEQYNAGVRIFDIRVKNVDKKKANFRIIHKFAGTAYAYQTPLEGLKEILAAAKKKKDWAIIKLGKSDEDVAAVQKALSVDANFKDSIVLAKDFKTTDKVSDAKYAGKLIVLQDDKTKQWKKAFPKQVGINAIMKYVKDVKNSIFSKWKEECKKGVQLKISFSTTGTANNSPKDNAIKDATVFRTILEEVAEAAAMGQCTTIVSLDAAAHILTKKGTGIDVLKPADLPKINVDLPDENLAPDEDEANDENLERFIDVMAAFNRKGNGKINNPRGAIKKKLFLQRASTFNPTQKHAAMKAIQTMRDRLNK